MMRSIVLLHLLLVCAGLCVAPARVQAQSDSDEAQAREHFTQGQRLVEDGQYERAYDEFRAGYELSEQPLFLFNMAECARKEGKPDQARADYERYLQQDPDGKMADKARERLAELRSVGESSGPQPHGEQSATDDAEKAEQPSSAARVPSPEQAARNAAEAENAEASARPTAATGARDGTPVWQRWYFWTAVGAVLVAGAVTGGVLATRGGGGPSCGADCQLVDLR